MSNTEKIDHMKQIVANSYCLWDMFWENVCNYYSSQKESLKFFTQKVKEAKDDKDLQAVVNLYI